VRTAKWHSWELLRRRIKTQSVNLFRTCVYTFFARCSHGRPIGFASRIMEMEPRPGVPRGSGAGGRACTDGPQLAACAAASFLSLAGQKGYLDGWSNHTPSAPTRASTRGRGSKINPFGIGCAAFAYFSSQEICTELGSFSRKQRVSFSFHSDSSCQSCAGLASTKDT
jgi:hypothetical protein